VSHCGGGCKIDCEAEFGVTACYMRALTARFEKGFGVSGLANEQTCAIVGCNFTHHSNWNWWRKGEI
jgi:hypothetical protein